MKFKQITNETDKILQVGDIYKCSNFFGIIFRNHFPKQYDVIECEKSVVQIFGTKQEYIHNDLETKDIRAFRKQK